MRTEEFLQLCLHATAEDVWNNLTLSAQQESSLNLLIRDLNDRFSKLSKKELKDRGIENVEDINMMELVFPQYKLKDGSIRLANRLDWSADELVAAFLRDVPAGQTYNTSVRRQQQEAKRAALHMMLAEKI